MFWNICRKSKGQCLGLFSLSVLSTYLVILKSLLLSYLFLYTQILIGLNLLVLVLVLLSVLNVSILKTLSIGLESFPISRQVLVLVLTEMKNQDTSWYWSQKKFYFKTCLGIGLEIKLISRQFLVLVLNKKGGLAELWLQLAMAISAISCQIKMV